MKQKKQNYIILMADIINSSGQEPRQLMMDFKFLVQTINEKYKEKLLSPLTITLGDEFQGVVDSAENAAKIIFDFEELILLNLVHLNIRFVCFEGIIETPINKNIAYEMLGEGLTLARKKLTVLKKDKSKFYFEFNDSKKSNFLNQIFFIFESLLEEWQHKEKEVVAAFIQNQDYKKVAELLGKNRSLIWKREKTLRMKDFFAIKNLIFNN